MDELHVRVVIQLLCKVRCDQSRFQRLWGPQTDGTWAPPTHHPLLPPPKSILYWLVQSYVVMIIPILFYTKSFLPKENYTIKTIPKVALWPKKKVWR